MIEYGHADVTIYKVDSHVDRLFAGLGETMHGKFPTQFETSVPPRILTLDIAYMSHFDKLVRLPEGFVVIAKTANSEFAGIAHKTKPIFGTLPLLEYPFASSITRQLPYRSPASFRFPLALLIALPYCPLGSYG